MEEVLRVHDLVKEYDGRAVVDAVTFDVRREEVVVLVGPNGSGKTTTIECCAGLRTPTGGTIEVDGVRPTGSLADRARIGLQLQESGLPPAMTVSEALALVASLYRDPLDPAGLISDLGLGAAADARYETLSGGQKRRLDVGLAIIGRPPLVVLDEPTSGVDPEGRAGLWRLVREVVASTGAGVLLTTHDLAEAEDHADRLLVLRDGRVVMAGEPAALLGDAAGDWRLRVRTPTSAQLAAVRSSAARHVEGVDGVTAFGGRDEMRRLRDELESIEHRPDGELLLGRTRLEDLFALSARTPGTIAPAGSAGTAASPTAVAS